MPRSSRWAASQEPMAKAPSPSPSRGPPEPSVAARCCAAPAA